MLRPKAVVAHPIWGRGGAEAAAMWIIEALLQDFDVTVYTRGGLDLDALNALAGTSINPAQVLVHIPDRTRSLLGGGIAHRRYLDSARRLASSYDLRVTASGSIDWGQPAVQFLSSLAWHPELRKKSFSHNLSTGLSHFIKRAGDAILERAWPMSYSSSTEDVFIANSGWTAAHSRQYCQGRIDVVYPAVKIESRSSGIGVDKNGRFLCFGRIAPEKRIEDCIRIIGTVYTNLRGNFGLDIVGEVDSQIYLQFLKARAAETSLNVRFLPPVYGAHKSSLLRSYSYGISCCDIEAFGIATAEMAASGVIVFAPELSAQSEILNTAHQLFKSQEEAADKIARVLSDRSLQASIRSLNREFVKRFDPETFKRRVRLMCVEFANQIRLAKDGERA